jgi:thioredoxin-disulfide reductase
MYDVIIIGSGPAGVAAAIYTVRREMKTLVIGQEVGGQIIWAGEIENYPGFKNITNFELISRFREQIINVGAELKEAEVQKIKKIGDVFKIFTSRETFEAKTVIIATGLSPRRLEIPGEIEFNGKGVSYCANCDGPLYKGKTVAVVGSGNSALDAAELMSKIASKVYLLVRGDKLKGFDSLVDEIYARENIEVLLNTQVTNITGENSVKAIKIKNTIDNLEKELSIDGIFVEIGRIAKTDLVAEFVDRDNGNQIIINERCETKTPGIFAAGDVTTVEFKQITIAMGQATIAALVAYQYLQLKK